MVREKADSIPQRLLFAFVALILAPSVGLSMCGMFTPFIPDTKGKRVDKVKDVLQPSQKAFITWNPEAKEMTVTVQPRFEGSAKDFGMVIPTPSQPKLDEMPRDFFKELAVFTTLKQPTFAASKLMALGFGGGIAGFGGGGGFAGGMGGPPVDPPKTTVKVVETGLVGSLNYKIITAERADHLYDWLKENKYNFKGDEATLDYYVKKKWVFTVMKIDTMQMKRARNGQYIGEITPTRFQFQSDKFIYPLKITQLSVKDQTEALFYVQAPFKVDLAKDWSYQYTWVPMLTDAAKMNTKMNSSAAAWLKAIEKDAPAIIKRTKDMGFDYTFGSMIPNQKGKFATSLEWAKRITSEDLKVLNGEAAYTETVPNVDQGYTMNDFRKGRAWTTAVSKVINTRIDKANKAKPEGYLVRTAAPSDLKQMKILVGHVKEGQFITKFRKVFTRDEMDEDMEFVPAKIGNAVDESEYEVTYPNAPQ